MTTENTPKKNSPRKATARRASSKPEPQPEGRMVAAPEIKVETEEQRQIRELKEQLANLQQLVQSQQATTLAQNPEDVQPKEGDLITIHFLEDGLTAQGVVWYRGQELTFEVGSRAWQDTLDRNGKSWVLLTDSDQFNRYGGRMMFRRGPWPGKQSYVGGDWEQDKGIPDEAELREADNRERDRRNAGAPALPSEVHRDVAEVAKRLAESE